MIYANQVPVEPGLYWVKAAPPAIALGVTVARLTREGNGPWTIAATAGGPGGMEGTAGGQVGLPQGRVDLTLRGISALSNVTLHEPSSATVVVWITPPISTETVAPTSPVPEMTGPS